MWFVIETKDKKGEPTAPHLHGMILMKHDDLNKTKATFKHIAKKETDGEISRIKVSVRPFVEPQDAERTVNYYPKNSSSDLYISDLLTKTAKRKWNSRNETEQNQSNLAQKREVLDTETVL